MAKRLLLVYLIFFAFLSSRGQSNEDYLLWSSSRRLTLNDFSIKTNGPAVPSFGQFSIDYQVNGFDFLTRKFNKKVRNSFIKAASWIDTTTNIEQSLIYQQTLFDIAEVYTRQFRRALKKNRKKIASGMTIVEELNNQFLAAFSKRRIEYDRYTQFGTNGQTQKEWEKQINKELSELSEFAYNK